MRVSWKPLCTNDEIWEWFAKKRQPRSLRGKLRRPGVYRFLLPDENSPGLFRCYIGEAECLQRRIREHLTLLKIKNQDSWRSCQKNQILGVLKNLNHSNGHVSGLKDKVSLEELIIEGGHLLGVPVNHHTLNDPFVRKMFENLELLRADHCFRLLNHRITVSTKEFLKMCKSHSC